MSKILSKEGCKVYTVQRGCGYWGRCLGIEKLKTDYNLDKARTPGTPPQMPRSVAVNFANRCIDMGCAEAKKILKIANTFPQ